MTRRAYATGTGRQFGNVNKGVSKYCSSWQVLANARYLFSIAMRNCKRARRDVGAITSGQVVISCTMDDDDPVLRASTPKTLESWKCFALHHPKVLSALSLWLRTFLPLTTG